MEGCELGPCGGQSDAGTGVSPCTSVFPRQDHSTDAQNSFICKFFLPEGQMSKAWEPSKKSNALLEIGGRWMGKCYQFLGFQKVSDIFEHK